MATPEYIRELRAMIAHHPLFLPGVSAVVLDDGGRVLLNRRVDTGRWAVLGGIMEPGEQPARTAVREVFEETRVHCVVERLVSVHTEPPVEYSNGDRAQYLNLSFRCRAIGGSAAVGDDESLDVGWFPLDELPALDPEDRQAITAALRDTATTSFVRPEESFRE